MIGGGARHAGEGSARVDAAPAPPCVGSTRGDPGDGPSRLPPWWGELLAWDGATGGAARRPLGQGRRDGTGRTEKERRPKKRRGEERKKM